MRVRILGGGVAGLACAVAMRRRCGFDDVVVLDRDTREDAKARAGHGLILMQNGVAALRALGADGFLDRFRALDQALVQDHAGTVLESEELHGVYCVTRAGIVEALRDELPADGVRYGRRATGIELVPALPPGRDPRTIRRELRSIAFEAGTPLTHDAADLFIGAEGWRSPMYAAFNPGAARAESPVSEIVTSTRLPELAAQLGSTFLKTVFAGRGLAFGLLSPSRDWVIGFLQFDRRRHGLPAGAELRAFVTRLVAQAPEPMASYLRLADFSTAHLWRPIDADLAAGQCGTNAVIVGDAAHPLLPFTSQGVGAALEDAVILADAVGLVVDSPHLLPRTLAGFAGDRTRDLAGYVDGGRLILANFLGATDGFVAPYLGGAVSRLAEHLSVPPADIRSLIGLLDSDGDGYLSRDDVRHALALIVERDIDARERDALFDEIDTNHDGVISQDEMLDAVAGGGEASPALWDLRRGLTPRHVGAHALGHRVGLAFRAADRDGDKLIDFGDFAVSVALFGMVADQAALRRIFDLVDADADGRVTQPQLAEAVRRGRLLLGGAADDELFADDSVDLAVLRQRSYNYRWAVQPPDVIPLTAADCDFPVCEEIIGPVQRYLSAGYVPYGPAEGLPDFRRIAADTLAARHGWRCDPDSVFPTDGAASAVFLVARLAIGASGDEAIVPDPVDFLLDRSVRAAGGVVRRWAVPGGRFDVAELESLVTPRTRLLSLCNPHNPFGRVLRRDELAQIAELALRHDLWILSDEVWSDIVFPPHEHVPIASLDRDVAARTFTVRGFSKSFGLAGMRLGLIVAPDRARRDQLMDTAHAHDTAYGASTVSQVAGGAALEHGGPWLARFVAHLGRQRDYAVARLDAMDDVRCATPEGTFVVFPDVSRLPLDQDRFAALLLERHRLAVVPGSPAFFGPGAAGHVRLSLATSKRILAEGLDRFEQGVHDARGTPTA